MKYLTLLLITCLTATACTVKMPIDTPPVAPVIDLSDKKEGKEVLPEPRHEAMAICGMGHVSTYKKKTTDADIEVVCQIKQGR